MMDRLLNVGEKIIKGDEIYTVYTQMEFHEWHKVGESLIGEVVEKKPIRRPVDTCPEGLFTCECNKTLFCLHTTALGDMNITNLVCARCNKIYPMDVCAIFKGD